MNKDEFGDFEIEDMGLEDDGQPEILLDMGLEGPGSTKVGIRISKLFPGEDKINLIEQLKIKRVSAGNYTIRGTSLKEIATWDRDKIDSFLRGKENE